METLDCIYGRREIRAFKAADVPEATVERIVKAAMQAPSAGNVQDWEFVIVRSREAKKALAEAAIGQDFIASAPVVVAVCSNLKRIGQAYGQRGVNLYSVQDTAAATQNLLLAAWDLGIGGCWVGAFTEQEVSRILFLPSHVRPLALVPLGVPAAVPPKPKRNPFKASLHKEKY